MNPCSNLFNYAKTVLTNAAQNLENESISNDEVDSIIFKVDWVISALHRATYVYGVGDSVIELLQVARRFLAELNQEPCYGFQPLKMFTACKGRPRYEIPSEQLELFLNYGFSMKQMGEMIGVSSKTIYRRLKELGLSIRDNFTVIESGHLDSLIVGILTEFPNCGYKRMTGFLRARGLHLQQSKIREAMRRTDPEGVLVRSLQLTTVARRSYNVHCPLQLWHLDGNHKLIRYKLAFICSKCN